MRTQGKISFVAGTAARMGELRPRDRRNASSIYQGARLQSSWVVRKEGRSAHEENERKSNKNASIVRYHDRAASVTAKGTQARAQGK
ncbi:hypothetical protein VTO73DRAFT_8439 [Trametes versicolor]